MSTAVDPLGEVKPAKPQQLRMIWPASLRNAPPALRVHADYALRTYQPGDEAAFFQVMDLAGFTGWNQEQLRPTLATVLPDGWFFIVHQATDAIVATAMASHQPIELHPFGGALNWVAGHPDHAGKGIGWSVCAAVTQRLLQAGYKNIYLKTDDWRLPAIKTYLRLGYQPFLFAPDMAARWQAICTRLAWPFTPQAWSSTP